MREVSFSRDEVKHWMKALFDPAAEPPKARKDLTPDDLLMLSAIFLAYADITETARTALNRKDPIHPEHQEIELQQRSQDMIATVDAISQYVRLIITGSYDKRREPTMILRVQASGEPWYGAEPVKGVRNIQEGEPP